MSSGNILLLALAGLRAQFLQHCASTLLTTTGWCVLIWFHWQIALGVWLLVWGREVAQRAGGLAA